MLLLPNQPFYGGTMKSNKFLTTLLFVTLLLSGFAFAQDATVPVFNPAIAVDGLFDAAWAEIEGYEIKNVWDAAGLVESEDDCSGEWKAFHDADNFYIIIKVKDDVLNDDSDGVDEHDDSFDVVFDTDNGDEGALTDPNPEMDDFMLTLEYSSTGVAGIAGAKWSFATLDVTGIKARCTDTEDGYIMEASIPLINLDLVGDETIGFGVRINDDDDGDTRDGQVTWFINDDSGHGWNNMTDLADVELTADEKLNIPDIMVPEVAPVIDGVIDDIWKVVPANAVAKVALGPELIDDEFDYGPTWKALHDDTYFYVLMEQTDDILMEDSEGVDHNDEFMDVVFDTDNGDEGPLTDPNPDTDDYMLKFEYSSTGDAGFNPYTWSFASLDITGVLAKCAETDAGYLIEVAIPLENLDLVGDELIGFGLRVGDDDDGGERDTQASWWITPDDTWNSMADLADVQLVADIVSLPGGTSVEEEAVAVVSDYQLSQNYPNPFNPTTTIEYALPSASSVRLVVYDLVGREVATLFNGQQSAGTHSVIFDASLLSSGIYFYRLEAGAHVVTKKLAFMK
ncbi:MAG: T9SS C-terminal target domain-containing protein [Calditrichaeota bacterium]|nr:MAG: T9SS C-terminal target domain-containing protein [Calditrichota bacterium]